MLSTNLAAWGLALMECGHRVSALGLLLWVLAQLAK
jgi:hypothetical protein